MTNTIDSSRGNSENWMNGLKGILALVIAFFWHYINFPMQGNPPLQEVFPTLYSYGGLAVELFFALSGFGMVIGYEKKIYNDEINFGSYIKRRVSKIYPLFFETLIFTLILNVVFALRQYRTKLVD